LLSIDRTSILQRLTKLGQNEFRTRTVSLYDIVPGTKPILTVNVLSRVMKMNGEDVSDLSSDEKNKKYNLISLSPVTLELLDHVASVNEETKKDSKKGDGITTAPQSFDIHDWVDAQDDDGNWWIAQIIDVAETPSKETGQRPFRVRFSERSKPPEIEKPKEGKDKTEAAESNGTTSAVTTGSERPWWEWENDQGQWAPYLRGSNDEIEQAYLQGISSVTLTMGYQIDFVGGIDRNRANEDVQYINAIQTNMQTNRQRNVRRRLTPTEILNKNDKARHPNKVSGPPPSDVY
jgi:hypothetical protein